MANDAAPAGKERKYALRELERRFLFSAPPAGEAVRTARIADRYLVGTRLRVRRYALLERLPAATLHKTRLSIPPLGVDI